MRRLPAFMVAMSGAADVNGRLVPTVVGWDVRFVAGAQDYVLTRRALATPRFLTTNYGLPALGFASCRCFGNGLGGGKALQIFVRMLQPYLQLAGQGAGPRPFGAVGS